MRFGDVKEELESLRECLRESTGSELFDEITVDEPVGHGDELDFFRLVVWGYVMLNEAGAVAIKHLCSMLRISDPSEMKKVSRIREDVHNLRTARTHNLPIGVKSNDHKRRQAEVWVFENGGDPPNWNQCCDVLCQNLATLLRSLLLVWKRSVDSTEDRALSIEQLKMAVDRNWPAHEFDPLVEEAAMALGISGLDIPKFRGAHLDSWRSYLEFFHDTQTARVAIAAVIHNELEARFVIKS